MNQKRLFFKRRRGLENKAWEADRGLLSGFMEPLCEHPRCGEASSKTQGWLAVLK